MRTTTATAIATRDRAPASPVFVSYPQTRCNPRGVPPAVARGLHAVDPPPRVSGTALDQGGWTPSSWATQRDPAPVSIDVRGARHTHSLDTDSLYSFKRLAHKPVSPLDATPENDWGLNPYDSNTPFLRSFHAWAHAQAQLVAARGYERGGNVRADRMPGLSTLLARSSPDVAGPRVGGGARQGQKGGALTPTQLQLLKQQQQQQQQQQQHLQRVDHTLY